MNVRVGAAKSAHLHRSHTPFVVGIGGAGRAETGVDVALLIALRGAEVAGANILFLGQQFLIGLQAKGDVGADQTLGRARLISAVARADGLILAGSTADGTLSPALRGALALLEETACDDDPAFQEKAVACIVAAHEPRIANWGLTSLRSAVHGLGGWPTPQGVAINLSEQPFQATGTCSQPELRSGLAAAGQQVVSFALARKAYTLGARHFAA